MTSRLEVRDACVPGRLAPTSLCVGAGELVAVIGPNGGGKTSLLRACAAVEGTAGTVRMDGDDLRTVPPARRARLLGYRPRRVAVEVVALSAVAVGACVSVCGAIGFVGLIAPYAGRLVTRGHPGRALLPAAVIGGGLLLIADLAVRFGPAGRTIPVGVLTTVAGTPLFVWIVVRMRSRVTA